MTQQHVVDEATAEAMFPHGFGPDEPGPHHPPSITWLVGPIWCDGCGGDTSTPMHGEHDCPRCEGRGYPSSLEIASDQTLVVVFELNDRVLRTFHGIIDLGAPVQVIKLMARKLWPGRRVMEADGVVSFMWTGPDDCTETTATIAGEPTPGGVVYPITVRT